MIVSIVAAFFVIPVTALDWRGVKVVTSLIMKTSGSHMKMSCKGLYVALSFHGLESWVSAGWSGHVSSSL